MENFIGKKCMNTPAFRIRVAKTSDLLKEVLDTVIEREHRYINAVRRAKHAWGGKLYVMETEEIEEEYIPAHSSLGEICNRIDYFNRLMDELDELLWVLGCEAVKKED